MIYLNFNPLYNFVFQLIMGLFSLIIMEMFIIIMLLSNQKEKELILAFRNENNFLFLQQNIQSMKLRNI